MGGVLNKRVLSTKWDRPDGTLGVKKLALLAAALVVLGALVIFLVQLSIASTDTFEATVTGVTAHTVNFTLHEGSGDVDVASYPEGMRIEVGDRIRVRADEEKGNVVLEVVQ